MAATKGSSEKRTPQKRTVKAARKPIQPAHMRYFHRDESWLAFAPGEMRVFVDGAPVAC